MLNRPREEVLQEVVNKIEYNLHDVWLQDGTWSYSNYSGNTGVYQSTHDNDSGGSYTTPHMADGWPPGLLEYIKRVSAATAVAIVEAIYTEKEMEEKVEEIILKEDDGDTSTNEV